MLWQSQMNMMQKYIPEKHFEDDVIFLGGDLVLCEQDIVMDDLNGDAAHAHHSNGVIFRETLSLQLIELGKAMDMQHDASCEWTVSHNPFVEFDTIKLEFSDLSLFECFYSQFRNIIHQ